MNKRNTKLNWHLPLLLPFISCVLLLAALEVWDHFSALPEQDWIAKNRDKMRVPDPDHFSFAVFGDNKNSHSVFENLLRRVDDDPDIGFAMDIGDMVYDGEKEKYRYFLGQLHRHFHKPLLTAIGNHELKENGRGLYYSIFGPFYYSFQIGRTYFIVLDDANEVGIDPWQASWLETELIKAQKCQQRLVFMHVPLFDPRVGMYHHCLPKDTADDLAGLFKKYDVTHIFASHIHGYYQGQWDSIPYTITGGAGAEQMGTDPSHYYFHYLKVSIQDKQTIVEVTTLAAPEYEWVDRVLYLAWLYSYSFLRIHGIELALLLVIAGLAIPAYRVAARNLRNRH